MGWFRSLKGDHPKSIGNEDAPSSHGHNSPNKQSHSQDFQPPPFPPPSHQSGGAQDFQPPPYPPPRTETLPPYHDWASVPLNDNSGLAPPPSFGFDTSPSSNSSRDKGDRAVDFCRRYPLWSPARPSDPVYNAAHDGDIRLVQPREYIGHLTMHGRGQWSGSSQAESDDSILLTNLPLYFAQVDSPLATESPKTIYFEVKILSFGKGPGNEASSLALGFAAQPYPPWRLPGWERASIGVHSDDGRRFVNNPWGGKTFTTPFRPGETVGLGIRFSIPDDPPTYGHPGPMIRIEVLFSRNGKKEGGWDMLEERDKYKDGGVDGLEGEFDLYGAIGIFGAVEFEASFDPSGWQWQPSSG